MRPRDDSRSAPEVRREFGGLLLTESFYAPRLRQPRHEHEPASFSLVLEGGYSETVGPDTFDCRPSTVVFRPPAAAHAVAFADAPVRIFRLDVRARVARAAPLPRVPRAGRVLAARRRGAGA
jgi:hypothetical protein